MIAILSLFVVALLSSNVEANSSLNVKLDGNENIFIDNGYSQLVFNQSIGGFDQLRGSFAGDRLFGNNILALPFKLETAISCSNNNNNLTHKSQLNYVKENEVSIDVYDCSGENVKENWIISSSNKRGLDISIRGVTLKESNLSYIAHSFYLTTPYLTAFYDRGLTQMMGKNNSCLATKNEKVERIFSLGNNNTAIDLIRKGDSQSTSVILSSSNTVSVYSSAITQVSLGNVVQKTSYNMKNAWDSSNCDWKNQESAVLKGQEWVLNFEIVANNYNFPVFSLNENLKPDLPFLDVQTYLTGIYASPVGCLQSFYDDQNGIVAPTISHPDVGYSPDSNFFDPDNFITMTALLYSGDDYLINQVKQVLTVTKETICGIGNRTNQTHCETSSSPSRTGQIMHHFIDLVPTYESIAGSTQMGPNIFFTKTVFRYISVTQDIDFAMELFPFIDLSTKFLLGFYDAKVNLFNAPGPLWIDVIVRENYTSDSNSALVNAFDEIADYYTMLNKDSDMVSHLRNLIKLISESMNANLWSGDHYVTQMNLDGTKRDFVDFDSNLMAVAFGIADEKQTDLIFKRIDSFKYAHVRATWCSELPYSGDRDDCYIVGGTVCGDSVVTLARIGYVDCLARKKIGFLSLTYTLFSSSQSYFLLSLRLTSFNDKGQREMFDNVLLLPLQNDLVRDTWLDERYDDLGQQVRTPYYFEYPSFIVMMLREIRYGVNLGLSKVSIDPFNPLLPFTLAFGQTQVSFSQDKVIISLPSFPPQEPLMKILEIKGLHPNTSYHVQEKCNSNKKYLRFEKSHFFLNEGLEEEVRTDDKGNFYLNYKFHSSCTLSLTSTLSLTNDKDFDQDVINVILTK